jgi:hypothetical protein
MPRLLGAEYRPPGSVRGAPGNRRPYLFWELATYAAESNITVRRLSIRAALLPF